MDKPLVILVGGFLGAGKTTLLAKATERLVAKGRCVGLITNDQAPNLVDTLVLQERSKDRNAAVREVSGGCFCCLFDDLVGSMDRLLNDCRPDILIGEPVGSCTDLSATVAQPIKAIHTDRYRLAPLTVLVDPDRVRFLVDPPPSPADRNTFPENVLYIYVKQLEEADVIAVNKADLLSPERQAAIENALRRQFPQARVLSISAKEGTGLDAWLDLVTGDDDAGRTIAEVDYDIYAEGEAALGWLNASYQLRANHETDWRSFCEKMMATFREEFLRRQAEIAHLKIHLGTNEKNLVGNLTTTFGEPSWRGEADDSVSIATLVINARVHIGPAPLQAVVDQGVLEIAGDEIQVLTEALQCFSPSRPVPVHRFAGVV